MAVESCVRPRGGCTCTETVITCTGDLRDPSFQRRFRSILKELRGIVCKGSDERLRVRKMEPWNSVRVTFSIGVEAAERLRALAEAGGEVLARLGILSVQLPNGQVISVRVNAPSTPPNVVAPAPSSIPPLVPSVSSASQATRFPFNSMAQASAIVSREAKACATPSQSHYPPPPYPELRQEPPQASPLLVNLLQTDQAGVTNCPTGNVRPNLSRSISYNTPTRLSAPPPPYTRPAQSPPTPRLPTPQQQQPPPPLLPPHQQESSPTASSSDPTTTPVTPSGKPVQYLINPLTGVLEPMSSESESDAEGPSIDSSAPINNPRSPSPPLTVPPRHHQVPLVTPQLTPLPLQPIKEDEDKTIKVTEDNMVTATQAAVGPPAPALNQVPPIREEIEATEEERPKGEEKIKLRLKLEKTENYNLSYKAEGSEPRVPPLHISLRGRPAVVSRKEKRLRKDESRERERLERERERDRERNEREPLSQGTFEGTCQFPSEAEVASILRSMPQGGKLLNTNVTARRKRDKKKIYPRSVPRVEEKLKKGSGSLLKSVVKSAAKEVRIMTAQRSSKPVQHKKPASPVLSSQSVAPVVTKPVPDLDFKAEAKFKETNEAPRSGGSSASGSGGGDDSGIESMDALSEKSPNQSTSPLRKEELPKKEKKEVEEVVPIRLTPALYTYSNPERQREETPSPDHTEEERYSGKSLLEQLLIDIPNGDASDRRATSHRSPEIVSPTIPLGKRGRRPSESSSSDPPTPRPNKRKCSENASELIKACMDEGKRETMPLPQVDNVDSSDDEVKRKEEDERLRLSEEKSTIRSTFNSRRSVRQAEIRERPSRKGSIQQKKEEVSSGTTVANKLRRRNSKDK